ncbi:tetratricopeptide repeat protein [Algoriphagus antarcticus]|uniref:Tetratricopeptide repeat protein n=1 Tax=Algoriphagus antarcticus TaxID=238540 RepID=A0A3E0DWD2_9BACT|nr:tetratricopeptide repeat protein [Algoriphagus antarcticus]REG90265.1 tetratricopeptide repeat protein [Algoriphagus antarcticus]
MKLFLVILFALISLVQFYGVGTSVEDEEKIKKIVRSETEYFLKRDSLAWKDLFVHGETTTRVYAGLGFYGNQVGWNNFGPGLLQWMKDSPTPSRYTNVKNSNYIINISDDLAWVTYDQVLSVPGVDSIPPSGSREFRTLVKDKQQWKISSIMTIDTRSYFNVNPESMEYMFNLLGYSYLEKNKTEEAIEVFKLNVKLNPEAWNTYDSLGEAYALAGNKDLAIENYRKSVELNPENEYGKEMLKKLK